MKLSTSIIGRRSLNPATSRILMWFSLEVLLTLAGTDDLADYSEFIFERFLYEGAAIVQLA
ncbi:MAG: hypothetical protein WBB01_20325 [Phormidesmis sp.]